jgi:hypothetical protein
MSTFEVAKRILKSVTKIMLDGKTSAHSDRADPNQAIGRLKRYECRVISA